jgi:hypothetical protein
MRIKLDEITYPKYLVLYWQKKAAPKSTVTNIIYLVAGGLEMQPGQMASSPQEVEHKALGRSGLNFSM